MKKKILVILFIAFTVFLYSAEQLNTALTYNLGIVSYRKGDYDDALQKFIMVYQARPDDFDTVYNLGNCHFKKKEYYHALRWYVKARRLKPLDIHNLYNLALTYVKVQRFELALKVLNTLMTLRNTEPKFYFLTGSVYFYQGDFANAVKNYKTGVQFQTSADTTQRESMKTLFMLYSLRREYTLAVHYAGMITRFYDNDAYFQFNLAYVYKNLGNFTEAVKHYRKALQINPEFKEAFINLLYIHNIEQKWDEVDKTATEALKKFPREFYFYVTRALAFYRQKKYKESLQMMKDAYALETRSVGAVEFIGHLELTLNNLPEALKSYEKVLIHFPSKVAVLVNLAYLYARTNDLVKGVLTMHLGLQNGADPIVYRYLAQLYLKAGDRNNAYQCYVHYLKKYPKGDYITFYNLARMYEREGKKEHAINYYIKSIKLNYLFFNSHFNLALLYENERNYTKAVNHYLLCTNIYENNFEPYFRIFYIYTITEEYMIACEYLEKAIKTGFRNVERIKESFKYNELKKIEKFQALMKKYFPNVSL